MGAVRRKATTSAMSLTDEHIKAREAGQTWRASSSGLKTCTVPSVQSRFWKELTFELMRVTVLE